MLMEGMVFLIVTHIVSQYKRGSWPKRDPNAPFCGTTALIFLPITYVTLAGVDPHASFQMYVLNQRLPRKAFRDENAENSYFSPRRSARQTGAAGVVLIDAIGLA